MRQHTFLVVFFFYKNMISKLNCVHDKILSGDDNGKGYHTVHLQC